MSTETKHTPGCLTCKEWQEASGLSSPKELEVIMDKRLDEIGINILTDAIDASAPSPAQGEGQPDQREPCPQCDYGLEEEHSPGCCGPEAASGREPEPTEQREGETLREWIDRCGLSSVEQTLKRERERYGVIMVGPSAEPQGASEFVAEYRKSTHLKLGLPMPQDGDVIHMGGPIMCEVMEAYASSLRQQVEEAKAEQEKSHSSCQHFWRTIPLNPRWSWFTECDKCHTGAPLSLQAETAALDKKDVSRG